MSSERGQLSDDLVARLNKEKVEATRRLPHLMVGLGQTIITEEVPVAAVDRDGNLYINPEGLANSGLPEGYTVCHEALHYALRHFVRSEGLDREVANVAADCVIAVILENIFSFKPPFPYVHPDYLNLPKDLTFEEYYKALIARNTQSQQNGHGGQGGEDQKASQSDGGMGSEDANQSGAEAQGEGEAQGDSQADSQGSEDANQSGAEAQGEGEAQGDSQADSQGSEDANQSGAEAQGEGEAQGDSQADSQGSGLGQYKDVGNSMDSERPWEQEAQSDAQDTDSSKPTLPRPVRDLSNELEKCGVRHEDVRACREHAIGSSPGGAVAKMSAPVEFDSRLYDYITEQLGWGDWTYRKPRYTIRPYILPSFSGGGRVGVICDTSGSMSDSVRRVVGLINGLLVNGITVNLVEGDTECQAVHVLTSPGDLDICGYGGTDMRQVYLDAICHLIDCDCIVMFTDCDSLDWPTQQEITIPLVVVAVYKDYRGSCPEHIPVIYLEDKDDGGSDWS